MTNITARVASMGLTYTVADSVWTMSNFVFKTSHYTGLRAESGTVITLVGTNTIVSGITRELTIPVAVDIDENVTFQGDGVLNATAADVSKARGLMSEGPFTVSDNACVMAKGNMCAVEGKMTEPDAAPEHATIAAVLTNSVEAAEIAGKKGYYPAWSNGTAVVVYKAESGWCFENGATEVTNKLDTSKNPAEDTPAAVSVEANGQKHTQDVTISAGVHTLEFATLPAEIKAKDAKVTLKLK